MSKQVTAARKKGNIHSSLLFKTFLRIKTANVSLSRSLALYLCKKIKVNVVEPKDEAHTLLQSLVTRELDVDLDACWSSLIAI